MKITRHPFCVAHDADKIAPDDELVTKLSRSFATFCAVDGPFAARFYRRLGETYPEIRRLFPADVETRPAELVATLRTVLGNLRAPRTVRQQLRNLGRVHATYGLQPAHYRLVCETLVQTMADTAGEQWTAELQAEWTSALHLVAGVMREVAAQPDSAVHTLPPA